MISSILKPSRVVNGKKYKEMSLIGEGGFAFVYDVMSVSKEDRGVHYALKKMICQTSEQLEEAKKEIDVMLKIQDSHILPLIDFAYSVNKKGQKEVLLLLPMYAFSLQFVVDQGPGFPTCGFVDGMDVLKILRQVASGLQAIHASGFRHADLKPANVLLSEDFHAVLTDFGSATAFPHTISCRAEALTLQDDAARYTTASYRAPELYNTPSECVVGAESDVWSLGCLTYCTLYSRSPFESAVEGLSTLSVMAGQYPIPESNLWAPEYLSLIAECLRVDPAQRPCLEVVITQLMCMVCPPLDLQPPAPLPTQTQSSTPRTPPSHPQAETDAESGLGASPFSDDASTSSSAVSRGGMDFADTKSDFEGDAATSHSASPPANPSQAPLTPAFDSKYSGYIAGSAALDTSQISEDFADFGDADADADVSSSRFEIQTTALSALTVGSESDFASAVEISGSAGSGDFVEVGSSSTENYVTEGFPPLMLACDASTGTSNLEMENVETAESSPHGYELMSSPNSPHALGRSAWDGTAGADAEAAGAEADAGAEARAEPDTETGSGAGADAEADVGAEKVADKGADSAEDLSDDDFGEFEIARRASNLSNLSNPSNRSSNRSSASPAKPTPTPPTPTAPTAPDPMLVRALASIDLASIIMQQSRTGVLREGPVNMMRLGGFPKKMQKKGVWMVLTEIGLVVRKSREADSAIHELLSLHRPVHLTPSDTLSVGINGLGVVGFTPRERDDMSKKKGEKQALGDWVEIKYCEAQGAQGGDAAFKSSFSEVRVEVSFKSKDEMNDWLDAIEERREAIV
ncbi:kinase-like domain-containing protein [Ochromonadaceae sp. CCMP2298]|nr:kinase-like domain-containing protein [Ochromonadaceae sp. CCMP2298]